MTDDPTPMPFDSPQPDDLAAGADRPGSLEAQRMYQWLPHIDLGGLPGKLIVLEGPDGSGRSTQIALLTEWLEWRGFAVQTMGLRRSYLLARDIDDVLQKNDVRRLTLALLYATDFYDQLENRIIPALRSGFVVLADRYIYTLIARAVVRGIDRDYLERVYDFAADPAVSFRLEVSPHTSFDRIFEQAQAISYWEAGSDLNLSNSLYASFIGYQEQLREELDKLDAMGTFHRVDGERSVPEINASLRTKIGEILAIDDLSYEPSEDLLHLWRR